MYVGDYLINAINNIIDVPSKINKGISCCLHLVLEDNKCAFLVKA